MSWTVGTLGVTAAPLLYIITYRDNMYIMRVCYDRACKLQRKKAGGRQAMTLQMDHMQNKTHAKSQQRTT